MRAMLRLVGLVVSIGLADSLNPTTVGPAIYLATGERPRRRVLAFIAGVFAVTFIGGALIALGPGQLLIDIVNRPSRTARHIVETVIGGLLIATGLALFYFRRRLTEGGTPYLTRERRSSALLGASIMALELPTAFPYFAAIAAIVGSGLGPLRQLVLLLLFNLCFILPLLAIVLVLEFAGDHAGKVLARWRGFLERHWPTVLGTLLVIAGIFGVLLGVSGLLAQGHGRVGRFARHFRHFLNP
jgi:cytochrome c biogenesis protein CcdA